MADFDAFNGDADGLCALLQLRLAQPRDATLVTGVKRDIALLERVEAGKGDRVTALDISLDKNRTALDRILAAGAEVFYCDHHYAGDIPQSDQLTTLINPAPELCTSLLINRHLKGQFAQWALVGAFGDNLKRSAQQLAQSLDDPGDLALLQRLGECLNYNAYGARIDDLHWPPDQLFERLAPWSTPTLFLHEQRALFDHLDQAYRDDMARAAAASVLHQSETAAVYVLPDAAWARRVSGVFGNQLANEFPDRAHAVLSERSAGGYLVSVRAPLQNRTGADTVCRQFETGGGRQAAAGINDLPADQLERFVAVLLAHYHQPANT